MVYYEHQRIGAPVTLWGPWYAGIAHEEGDFLKVQSSFASMLRHEVIVADIDGIVRKVRFPGWQNTSTGRKEVSKNLRDIILKKYRIKDAAVFNEAYGYIEQYY